MLVYETYGDKRKIYPRELEEAAREVPETVERVRSESHEMNWMNAILGEEKISAPFAYSARLTENMLLGTAAVRAGKVLHYDPVNMRFPNAPEADQFLGREYREGWSF